MNLSELARLLRADILVETKHMDRKPVRHVVACDLMSDVLVADHEDHLLVTSLASAQSVRTASLVGAAGVLLVNGKPLPAGMQELARELDVTLLRTPLPKFEACVAIGRALDAGKAGA